MARSRRARSTSGGSFLECSKPSVSTTTTNKTQDITGPSSAYQTLLSAMLEWRHADSGRTLLHACQEDSSYFTIAALLLARLRQLPDQDSLHGRWLTVRDEESGYTPLHAAILHGDLRTLWLMLRHASSMTEHHDRVSQDDAPLVPPRCTVKPLDLLKLMRNLSVKTPAANQTAKSAVSPLLYSVLSARDKEGYTPGQLLASLQIRELRNCRRRCVYRPSFQLERSTDETHRQQRARSLSFVAPDDEDDDEEDDATRDTVDNSRNEFRLLARFVEQWPHLGQVNVSSRYQRQRDEDVHYACEVFTFGRANPCALGLGQDSTPEQVRPQRVHAFAQSRITDGAVHVAAAAHHTLVVTKAGHLYAFGLGKGGRLGNGSEGNVPLPQRVLGTLTNKIVVAVAAAENHSMCVTQDGLVFSWGSNGFGQLGLANASCTSGINGTNIACSEASRSLPRRVDDLKGVHCVSVAAGLKHSVALSQRGEVYAWGDNTAGQLSFSRRNGIHKVQRVEALWSNSSSRKEVVAIAASDQSTLVLALPSDAGIPVNSIYIWGHGNHVPSKVQFDSGTRVHHRNHPVNPVSIACAKYHCAAVSSDGLVYTWGLHAEPLGTAARSAASQPQLVTGMLPENGGGRAVAVSASENHTAVITETGALYTWGATSGKDVMGHAGVRWQEEPRCVPGVYRAVGVAAAREHTVLLIGTSFPPLPKEDATSLVSMTTRRIAEHLDIFNILPSLVVAERTASVALIDYCLHFIRRNLDGILSVAQRSVLDCYLHEQLQSCFLNDREERDDKYHPLLGDMVRASAGELAEFDSWIEGCEQLVDSFAAKMFIKKYSQNQLNIAGRLRSFSEGSLVVHGAIDKREHQQPCSTSAQKCSDRCRLLTEDMDLSTKELTQAKQACIAKEVRAVRKRLSQIDDLMMKDSLTPEQREKVSRRQQLDMDLLAYGPALERIVSRLQEFDVLEAKAIMDASPQRQTPEKVTFDKKVVEPRSQQKFLCHVCGVKCPCETSYASHISGRKHKNKLLQVEEEEKQNAISTMLEQRLESKFVEATLPAKPTQKTTCTAWNKSVAASSPLPNYKLPGPPHSTPSSIVSSERKPVYLRDIIEEEASKVVTNTKPSLSSARTRPPSSALRASPVAAPVRTVAMSSPATKAPSVLSSGEKPCPRPTLALGEFVPKPAVGVRANATKASLAWNLPKSSPKEGSGTNASNFLDIQKQQADFKERQANTCSSPDTKWYIEPRERAGSLKDIQLQHEKEEKERLYIEDQFRIEKQIMEELALAKRPQPNKKPRSRGKKKAPSVDGDQQRPLGKKSQGRARGTNCGA